MNEQPKALRLADDLDGACNGPLDFKHKAAAELRRLHKMNAELVGALKDIRDNYDCDEDAHKYGSRCRSCIARAAIAKATGEQQ